jgi:hypothetical protein
VEIRRDDDRLITVLAMDKPDSPRLVFLRVSTLKELGFRLEDKQELSFLLPFDTLRWTVTFT